MTAVKCPSCGQDNPPQARFCDNCAFTLPVIAQENDKPSIIRIGSASDNDLVLDYPMISGHHARVIFNNGAAVIEDLGSTNGTAIGNAGRKVTRAPLTAADTIFFGSFPMPAARLFSATGPLVKKSVEVLKVDRDSIVIGRDPQCDHPLDHPMISWHHARITRSGKSFTIEDLGSTNGTFVNGERLKGPVKARIGDTIGLGSYTFVFAANGTIEQHDLRANVTLEAKGVNVAINGKRLIEDVSLTIYPSEIVALMGPSGAGKTTLMNALNGYTMPSRGSVLINGQDLFRNYDRFRGHIGYVPQDDIMHHDLTVRQALYYTARLRLPDDSTEASVQAQVNRIIGILGLEMAQDVIIGSPEKKGISGGQRKRVNLAMELLTDPSILILDEPTSGLSSEDALMVMEVLRRLADEGKSVLITIHQPGLEVFRQMDNLVVMSRDDGSALPGRMVYYGPAYPDSIQFFNPGAGGKPGAVPMPDDVLKGLKRGKQEGCLTEDWLAIYGVSRYKREYVDQRSERQAVPSAPAMAPKIKRDVGARQWWTLVQRNAAIKARDIWNTVMLLALAPIIGLMIVLTLGNDASKESPGQGPAAMTTYTIFFLVISAVFLGCWNALREIVGEWAIYHRERMVNLKIPSYVASKFAVLGGLLTFIQCPILFGIVYRGSGLKGPLLQMLSVMILISLVALGIGLLISALVRTSELGTSLAILIMILMILMSGLIGKPHLEGKPARPITHLIASRWGFESMLLLESGARGASIQPAPGGLNSPAVDGASITMAEPFFPRDQRFGVGESVAILVAMLITLVAAIMLVLKLRDVH